LDFVNPPAATSRSRPTTFDLYLVRTRIAVPWKSQSHCAASAAQAACAFACPDPRSNGVAENAFRRVLNLEDNGKRGPGFGRDEFRISTVGHTRQY